MLSRLVSCIVPLSMVFSIIGKSDGLPRKSSYNVYSYVQPPQKNSSKKYEGGQAEWNSTPDKFQPSTRSAGQDGGVEDSGSDPTAFEKYLKEQSDWNSTPDKFQPSTRSAWQDSAGASGSDPTVVAKYEMEQAEWNSPPHKFEPPTRSAWEDKVATFSPNPTAKEFVPHQTKSAEKKLVKTFAQALMSGTSKSNEDRSVKAVQQQFAPDAGGQTSSTDRGTDSELHPSSHSEDTSSYGEGGPDTDDPFIIRARSLKPIKTRRKIKEKYEVNAEPRKENGTQLEENYNFEPTAPNAELKKQYGGELEPEFNTQNKAVLSSEPVSVMDHMNKAQTSAASGIMNTYGIQFGSFDREFNISSSGGTGQPSQTHHEQNENEADSDAIRTEEGHLEIDRKLDGNSTIDSDVFGLNLDDGTAAMLDRQADKPKTPTPANDSEFAESTLTRDSEINDSDDRGIRDWGLECDEVDPNETIDEETAERLRQERKCSFILHAEDKKSMLVIPLRQVNVFSELDQMNIDVENFGVCFKKYFTRSGAVLFKFRTVKDTAELCLALVASKNLKMRSKKDFNLTYIVRIYSLPEDLTYDGLSYIMQLHYGQLPLIIGIADRQCFYEDEECYERTAIMRVNSFLMDQIRLSPTIYIGGEPYNIDTSVDVLRCYRCHLIGHERKDCTVPPRHARPPPPSWARCIDCRNHNKMMRARPGSWNWRDENHTTNADCCSTKIDHMARHAMRRNVPNNNSEHGLLPNP